MATQGKKPGGGMTVAEAGRMGGRLVSEKYGPEFYERIGKKGGSTTAERYGSEFFGKIGAKGGKKVESIVERAKQLEDRPQRPEAPQPPVGPEETIRSGA